MSYAPHGLLRTMPMMRRRRRRPSHSCAGRGQWPRSGQSHRPGRRRLVYGPVAPRKIGGEGASRKRKRGDAGDLSSSSSSSSDALSEDLMTLGQRMSRLAQVGTSSSPPRAAPGGQSMETPRRQTRQLTSATSTPQLVAETAQQTSPQHQPSKEQTRRTLPGGPGDSAGDAGLRRFTMEYRQSEVLVTISN